MTRTCPTCNGKGIVYGTDGKPYLCPKCNGEGVVDGYKHRNPDFPWTDPWYPQPIYDEGLWNTEWNEYNIPPPTRPDRHGIHPKRCPHYRTRCKKDQWRLYGGKDCNDQTTA